MDMTRGEMMVWAVSFSSTRSKWISETMGKEIEDDNDCEQMLRHAVEEACQAVLNMQKAGKIFLETFSEHEMKKGKCYNDDELMLMAMLGKNSE